MQRENTNFTSHFKKSRQMHSLKTICRDKFATICDSITYFYSVIDLFLFVPYRFVIELLQRSHYYCNCFIVLLSISPKTLSSHYSPIVYFSKSSIVYFTVLLTEFLFTVVLMELSTRFPFFEKGFSKKQKSYFAF